MAQGPPANPGTMTPESKSALGSRLDLESTPDPLAGANVVPDGDLSDGRSALTAVNAVMGAAYDQQGGYQRESHDVVLASPMGSVATEGYHLHEQAAAINDQGHLDVGPVPDRPPQERV